MYKYHIVYKTTNIVNNKIYVGLHSTDNIDDGYIGSGFVLKSAIQKYGKDKFKREVLYIFDERSEARAMEASIVDEDFVKRLDTYNLIEGGGGAGNQWGDKNHMYGKVGIGAKSVKATHIDGSVIIAESIQELADTIGIARGNIRNLIKKQVVGRKGWRVELCKDIV
jgi:hypothetical protein